MAAKQQEGRKEGRRLLNSRKKTRDVKKNKPQKKHQPVRQKQMHQPQKAKKRQSQIKRQAKRAKAGSSGQEGKICSPRLFASKILRQMPKVRMEAKARSLMKTMLTNMYTDVATHVETSLSQKNEPSAISVTDVQTALREAMTKELAKHTAEQPPTTPSECA